MKAVVFAYQDIGFVCLRELLLSGVHVSSLFTHDDDPAEEIWFRRPATLAEERNIPIYKPTSLNDNKWISTIHEQDPDFIFSFYYRYMIPREILNIPRVAALNLHGSLLPKYRGRAPVNWVLVNGEKETGVTLHEMIEKPDAGDIVAQERIEISFEDDVGSLYVKMSEGAGQLMRETLPALKNGTLQRLPQSGPSSYFGGRKPEDGLISWHKDALSIYNLTRAVTHPYPGAYTFIEGRKLFVWKAYPHDHEHHQLPGSIISLRPLTIATGDGSIRLLRLQLENGPEMEADEFVLNNNIENKILGGNT